MTRTNKQVKMGRDDGDGRRYIMGTTFERLSFAFVSPEERVAYKFRMSF